ncbi:MAG: hypothetical protein SGILL_009444, partial [Bacillariaceae sp.]
MLMEMDNFYFLGGGGYRAKGSLLKGNNESWPCTMCITAAIQEWGDATEEDPYVEQFRERIRYHLSENHNIIFSTELIADNFSYNWERLRKILYLDDFNVRVAMTYRHLVDWFPS